MKDNKIHWMLRHKRNQLRIDDDVQQDWANMKAMLDMQMPVNTPGATGSSGASGLPASVGIKVFSLVLAITVVATLGYFILKSDASNDHHSQKAVKTIKHNDNNYANHPSSQRLSADSANTAMATINATAALAPINDNTGNRLLTGRTGTRVFAHADAAKTNDHAGLSEQSRGKHYYNAGNHMSRDNLAGNINSRIRNGQAGPGVHKKQHSTQEHNPGGLLVNIKGGRHHANRSSVKSSAGAGFSGKTLANNTLTNLTIARNDATERYNTLEQAAQAGFTPILYRATALPPSLTGLFNTPDIADDDPPIKCDWYFSAGFNPSGSFTSRNQNINFYGHLPVDLYFGLTGVFSFSDHWGASIGLRALTPRNLSGTYTHKNDSKKDTLQTLYISDSRKLYFLDIPVNVFFKPASSFNVKAGTVLSIPVQQSNGNSTFYTGPLQKDTAYYNTVRQNINTTSYNKGLIMGLSAGIGLQRGRFLFEADYSYFMSLVPVTSPLGGYNTGRNEFLFSAGFKLNKK
ncbi:hypothetical protein BEL04_00975 [Mucilaginibacter sp. PPCGB 2223]|uniref:hypothetical protein n=1 Tax=Mucilaginibacter sp. PPCGB 2223 TaxID=1886027 RepID=UPI000825ADD3|nr:hypothetical protein [Mucilaginibacter sp. PPCGB 2223]OCX52932.1 hypothetical protein BEL04_00975 [Mucilaginibacter sp. PPCGB 2223]